MCRPVRAFPCRIICYSPPPLTQHPRHAAEALISASTAHTFGSYESASATIEAQHRTDKQQHTWNANSLPSTKNTAKPASDMIATPRHFTLGPLGFPHLVTPTSAAKQWVCQGIDRRKNCLSSSYGAVGSVVTACPPHYQVFQLYYPLMNFQSIGVALRALGLLHLEPTFILRGRCLLNLLHSRSDPYFHAERFPNFRYGYI